MALLSNGMDRRLRFAGSIISTLFRKFGKFTVPDFIGDRYYSKLARLIAVFCAITISFVYVCGQMQGAGIVFSRFLEVDITTGVVIGMHSFLLCGDGWNEGHHLHPGSTILCFDFCFYGASNFYFHFDDRIAIPQIGFGAELTESFGGGYLLDRLDGMSEELGFATYRKDKDQLKTCFLLRLH